MSDSFRFSNVETCNEGARVPFVVGEGRPFFNLRAYPCAFGVYLGCATGAALSYLATLPRSQRAIHVLPAFPPCNGKSLPSAVDADAFVFMNVQLRRMGFIISRKAEQGFLDTLRVH